MVRIVDLRLPQSVALLLVVAIVATGWSAIAPTDYATWFFELSIGAAGVAVLVATCGRFRFSGVVYVVVAVHYVILAAGAKYTYADMPLFDWLQEALGLSRNYYDRVGHFAQGFTAALVTRELLLRGTGLKQAWVIAAVAVSAGLSFSAAYEIFEWLWVLAFYPDRGPEWLGMQGDVWDAQADMLTALVGAAAAMLFLRRIQDRQVDRFGVHSN